MRKTQEAYLSHTRRSAQKLRAAAETIQTQNVSLEQANRLLKERSTAAMESLSATVDARDAYTAGHSRRVQQLALAIGRELEPLAGRARPPRPRGALPRHRQARDPRLDPAQAREPRRGGVGADAAPRRRGRPDHRPARLPRRRGAGDPAPPRALRRHRLPRPAARGGDPARRAHHPRRRRARLDADDARSTGRPARWRRRSQELRRAAGSQFCPRCVAALERILPARRRHEHDAGPRRGSPPSRSARPPASWGVARPSCSL